jgi:hypothetical protein
VNRKGSSPADSDLRSAIEDEIAAELARTTNTNPSRIQAIVSRIGNHLTGLTISSDERYREDLLFSLRHSPGLETAIEILPHEQALKLFETADLQWLTRQVLATQYLSDPTRPFYTLTELGQAVRAFITHLIGNRDALIEIGLPNAPFSRSSWLQSHLGGLYFVTHPPVLHRMVDKNDLTSLEWAAPEDKPPRDPDWLDLGTIQTTRIQRLRELVFDLRLRILRELLDAIETRSGDHVRNTCLMILKDTLTAKEVSFLIKMDALISKRHDPWAANGRAQMLFEADYQTGSGGILSLLQMIAHVEQELIIGQIDKTKHALGPLAQSLSAPSTRSGEQYYRLLGESDSEIMTKALDCFLNLESKVHALAQDFYQQAEREIPANFEIEFFVTVRTKKKHASQLTSLLGGFGSWLSSQIESEDGAHSIPTVLATIESMVTSNDFRMEGNYWTLKFEGKVIRQRDSKGLQHIARLLARPGKEIPTVELQRLASNEITACSGDSGHQSDTRTTGISVTGSLGGGEELLDESARTELRARLRQLNTDREAATQSNNDAQLQVIDLETQRIKDHLEAGMSLGRRPRRQPNSSEKARQTVSSSIRNALGRIGKAHDPLWRHLKESLKLGTSCSYSPHDPVKWRL